MAATGKYRAPLAPPPIPYTSTFSVEDGITSA